MKTKINNNIKMFSIINSFRDNVRHEPMVSLGNSFELLRFLRAFGWRVIFACSDSKISIFRELKILTIFAKYLLSMNKHHGSTYVVKYLKSCHLALLKAISKDKIKSLREIEPDLPLPRLTKSSLPRFIPLSDRRAILSGNTFRIRYWLTLFSLYRIIKVNGVLKLNTITDPFSGSQDALQRGLEDLKLISFKNSSRFRKDILMKDYGLLALETASPSFKSSWLGLISDVKSLTDLGLDKPLKTYLRETFQGRLEIYFSFIQECSFLNNLPKSEFMKSSYPSLGQLSIKEEAAGKVRVFAMVDLWTQSCLKPLHSMLFAFLKTLPNDGTFDQFASVKRCQEKVKVSKKSFGFDLSAATDRLPISLQVAILSPIIGENAANAWKELLTSRSYILNNETYGIHEVKYSVGQPMGALSSWAMLAVTHHFIVQLAYKQSHFKFDWFDGYELLGDDIVIFDERVATQYLSLMEGFGVGINMSKSIISKNESFEFAKVSSLNGQFLSAISWKMFLSQNNMMGRVNILFQLIPKMNLKHPSRYFKNVLRRSILDLGSYKFHLIALLSMFANSGKMTYMDLLKTLIIPIINPFRNIMKDSVQSLNETYTENIIIALFQDKPIPYRSSAIVDKLFLNDLPWHEIQLWKRILLLKHKFKSQEDIIKSFTDKMVNQLIPGVIPEHLCYCDYTNSKNLISSDLEYQTIYQMFYSISENFLGNLSFIDNLSVDSSKTRLEDLLLVNEKFDRLIETTNIFDRANKKNSGIASARISDKSPLNALKFILKSNKKRPLWTMKEDAMLDFKF